MNHLTPLLEAGCDLVRHVVLAKDAAEAIRQLHPYDLMVLQEQLKDHKDGQISGMLHSMVTLEASRRYLALTAEAWNGPFRDERVISLCPAAEVKEGGEA